LIAYFVILSHIQQPGENKPKMAFTEVIDNAKNGVSNYLDCIAHEMEKALGKVTGDFVALDKRLEEEKAERRKLQEELDAEKLRRTEIEQKLAGLEIAASEKAMVMVEGLQEDRRMSARTTGLPSGQENQPKEPEQNQKPKPYAPLYPPPDPDTSDSDEEEPKKEQPIQKKPSFRDVIKPSKEPQQQQPRVSTAGTGATVKVVNNQVMDVVTEEPEREDASKQQGGKASALNESRTAGGFGTSRKAGAKRQDSMSKEGHGFARDEQQQKRNTGYNNHSRPVFVGRGEGGAPRGQSGGGSKFQGSGTRGGFGRVGRGGPGYGDKSRRW